MEQGAQVKSVLVIEDVPDMLSLIGHVVEKIPGFSVSGLAKNTAEARLEMSRRRPDVILLDEILPGESSSELLLEIRSLEIPVILITSQEKPSPLLPEGALSRIAKPGWKSMAEDQKRIEIALKQALVPGKSGRF